MNPRVCSDERIRERVQELVASVEQYARLTKAAAYCYDLNTHDLASITVSLAAELAELLGSGRLEVSREP